MLSDQHTLGLPRPLMPSQRVIIVNYIFQPIIVLLITCIAWVISINYRYTGH